MTHGSATRDGALAARLGVGQTNANVVPCVCGASVEGSREMCILARAQPGGGDGACTMPHDRESHTYVEYNVEGATYKYGCRARQPIVEGESQGRTCARV